MGPPNLSTLPYVILDLILQKQLREEESYYLEYVTSFAQTSKSLYAAAIPRLFRCVSMCVHDAENLATTCEKISSSENSISCPGMIAEGLLDTIHEFQPACHLHIKDFDLPCSDPRATALTDLDWKIIFSPCLSSIYLRYRDVKLSIYIKVIRRMVSGLAPRLKSVETAQDWGDWDGMDNINHDTSENDDLLSVPEIDFQGLFTNKELPFVKGTLANLWLSGSPFSEDLETWSQITDFRCLESLGFDPTLRLLYDLEKSRHTFPLLDELQLRFKDPEVGDDMKEEIEKFFDRLNPLRSLRLDYYPGDYEELLRKVMKRHAVCLDVLTLDGTAIPCTSGVPRETAVNKSFIGSIWKRVNGSTLESRLRSAIRMYPKVTKEDSGDENYTGEQKWCLSKDNLLWSRRSQLSVSAPGKTKKHKKAPFWRQSKL
ncbi:hypothetical protein FE257_012159 [Aspergillus nanangensis]|uniref:Uncharacterized protein n=1 Tax=Aspergillus nanangensis TaxID=2582783 RepID=A0AAD4CGA6_ASPNN|nr:hypothetical protein FE257_012159 [Aspergillus nanangensis]